MKSLLLGILAIVILGIGGLVYRNAVEHPLQPIACPLDALTCPDGTSVARTGSTCTFSPCPLPNVSLSDIAIAFALPADFAIAELPDASSVAAYERTIASTTSSIIIRRYVLTASSTALDLIHTTAISGTSGAPVNPTTFSSVGIAERNYTRVPIERFEGVVDTAYYLKHGTDLLRFDAIDREVMNWTDPRLTVTTLPAHAALAKMLTTLQGQ